MQLRPFHRFDGFFDASAVDDLKGVLLTRSAPRTIIVDSLSGVFVNVPDLVQVMEQREIITIADHVGGAGIIMTLLGKERYAFPDSEFHFFEFNTYTNINGEIVLAEMSEVREYAKALEQTESAEFFRQWLNEVERAQNWLLTFMQRRVRIPVAQILDMMRSRTILSTDEALLYGFIDGVVPRGVTYDA